MGTTSLTANIRRFASRFRQRIPPPPIGAASPALSAAEGNPFPFYEQLREKGSVHFLQREGVWVVLGYQEVLSALTQPQLFSSKVPEWMAVDSVLLGADPPEHTAVRRILGNHFSTQSLEREATFAEEVAERLLRPLTKGGSIDAFRDFGRPLSEEVAANFIGFEAPTLAAIRALNGTDLQHWLHLLDSIIETSANRISMYEQLLQESDGTLSHEDARGLLRFLWIAGTTTTRRAIASSVMLLINNPSLRSEISADASLLSAFVEESLRLHPPEHMIARLSTHDVELAGVRIPSGAVMKLCVAAANRDPIAFKDPKSVVLNRPANRHLSLGSGIHRCLGGPLARLEMMAALRTLLRVAPDFHANRPLGELAETGFRNDTEQLVLQC